MRVTIVKDDGTVSVDGRVFDGIDMTGFENIHAVQWFGDSGEVEYKFTGEGIKPRNMGILSLEPFKALIDQWESKRAQADTPPVLTLDELKSLKRSQINADRDSAIESGVDFNGNRFDSDQRSRDNLTGSVSAFAAGVPIPDGFAWRSADNKNISMDLPALIGLAAAMLLHVNQAYAESWQRKAAVDEAQDEAAVEAA